MMSKLPNFMTLTFGHLIPVVQRYIKVYKST